MSDECLIFFLSYYLQILHIVLNTMVSWSCYIILNIRVMVSSLGEMEIRVLKWILGFLLVLPSYGFREIEVYKL